MGYNTAKDEWANKQQNVKVVLTTFQYPFSQSLAAIVQDVLMRYKYEKERDKI